MNQSVIFYAHMVDLHRPGCIKDYIVLYPVHYIYIVN